MLSSHTKLIHIDENHKIAASLTTLSGQLYEAILKETSMGKSLTERNDEKSGGYSFEEVVSIAEGVVNDVGLDRCFVIPRFMQVLLTTDYKERNLFIDAAIAADEMKCIAEFEKQGYFTDSFLLFGHESRCKIYSFLIKKKYGDKVKIVSVSDKSTISELTVKGAIVIANRYQELVDLKNQNGGIQNV